MSTEWIQVEISDICQVAGGIREFTLSPPSHLKLPSFTPGSFVMVDIPTPQGRILNAYTLLVSDTHTNSYRIAVKLHDDSRGGSRFLHQGACIGDRLFISQPENHFAPQEKADKHLMIASDAGINPYLSYLPRLSHLGQQLELHYQYHSAETGAYRDQLKFDLGKKCYLYDRMLGQSCNFKKVLKGQPAGTHLYLSGQPSFTRDVEQLAQKLGWDAQHIHVSAFARNTLND